MFLFGSFFSGFSLKGVRILWGGGVVLEWGMVYIQGVKNRSGKTKKRGCVSLPTTTIHPLPPPLPPKNNCCDVERILSKCRSYNVGRLDPAVKLSGGRCVCVPGLWSREKLPSCLGVHAAVGSSCCKRVCLEKAVSGHRKVVVVVMVVVALCLVAAVVYGRSLQKSRGWG